MHKEQGEDTLELLDNRDWEILLEYDRDPFQSYNSIAGKIGIHHATVADRIASMKDRGILEADGTFVDPARNNLVRPTSEVVGSYSPNRLGLSRLHVIFDRVNSVKDFEKLQVFCNQHPYTHYMAKLFGKGVSLYTQFDIPPETMDKHLETFRKLKAEYASFDDLTIFQDHHEIQTVPNYTLARDQAAKLPSFDPIATLWEEFIETDDKPALPNLDSGGSFDNLDAELIRDLTINAKLSMTELADYYSKNKSTISRRIAKIRKQFVTNARLVFGDNADLILGYNNTQIVTGRFTKDSEVNKTSLLQFFQQENVLPFEAFITASDTGFILYTQASIGYAGAILQFLYKNTNPFYLNQYQFYISDSTRYYYYHENFDQAEGYRTDDEWIVDYPLRQLTSS